MTLTLRDFATDAELPRCRTLIDAGTLPVFPATELLTGGPGRRSSSSKTADRGRVWPRCVDLCTTRTPSIESLWFNSGRVCRADWPRRRAGRVPLSGCEGLEWDGCRSTAAEESSTITARPSAVCTIVSSANLTSRRRVSLSLPRSTPTGRRFPRAPLSTGTLLPPVDDCRAWWSGVDRGVDLPEALCSEVCGAGCLTWECVLGEGLSATETATAPSFACRCGTRSTLSTVVTVTDRFELVGTTLLLFTQTHSYTF